MTETRAIRKKLNGMDHVLWINLDTETDRKDHMKGLFDFYGIENTRISAIDARGDNDVSDFLVGKFPELVSKSDVNLKSLIIATKIVKSNA